MEIGDRTQVFRVCDGVEPMDLDPQTAIGQGEHDIMLSLFEGLVTADPVDVSPKPGVAESWDISPDGRVYTFHLRHNARWSNGETITAHDFIESHRRMLMPSLATQYSYMLYPVTNAEAFNNGKITNFDEVGFKALNDFTLQITLHDPTPYLLTMMTHDSWYPVPLATIKKYGAIDDRSNPWTRPENFVGNGAFLLKEWRMNSHILVEKNPLYWDAASVRLNKIYFDPTESFDTEERMFRSGQLHTVLQAPASKVAFYRKYHPDLIRVSTLYATYMYKMNTTRAPLNDKRVRAALAMALDRRGITETVSRAGEEPAFSLVPPGAAGYIPQGRVTEDVEAARKLLAAAGYPNGAHFPPISLLFNTAQNHKAIAEAAQQMWKKNLNIDVTLRNEEWKVYLDSERRMDYDLVRTSWVGDYPDPSTFMELYMTGGGNNNTGWSDPEYDRLVTLGGNTNNTAVRWDAYHKAEAILMDQMPFIPIYFYTEPRLLRPSVKGFYPNLTDQHPYKYVYLDPSADP
ncbi:MAG TPA: peptide ABC transporter substrate-binding protein [Verrucomicrobiae bacterium]|nr:peptide ABC transporter substrate-binding protein [Verrucomicrobiae bacterium]